MTTLGGLIDRTMRDWLEPADDQPGRLLLTAGMTATDTTLHFDSSLIGPEELAIAGPGTLIEVGSEEMIVGDIDEDSNVLSGLLRGVNGTDASTHDSGDFALPNPLWRRRVIFDALSDCIVQLSPELYQVASTDLLRVGSTFTEVPADVADLIFTPMWFLSRSSQTSHGWRQIPLSDADFLSPFPPSSTGKAFMVPGCHSGSTGYLTYKASFARPEFEIDDLEDDLGVQAEWETIVMVSAVAYLVAGRELDLATQERLSKQLEQQNYPAGTPTKIRDGLLRYRSYLVAQAQADLQVRFPVTVSMHGVWG